MYETHISPAVQLNRNEIIKANTVKNANKCNKFITNTEVC